MKHRVIFTQQNVMELVVAEVRRRYPEAGDLQGRVKINPNKPSTDMIEVQIEYEEPEPK